MFGVVVGSEHVNTVTFWDVHESSVVAFVVTLRNLLNVCRNGFGCCFGWPVCGAWVLVHSFTPNSFSISHAPMLTSGPNVRDSPAATTSVVVWWGGLDNMFCQAQHCDLVGKFVVERGPFCGGNE